MRRTSYSRRGRAPIKPPDATSGPEQGSRAARQPAAATCRLPSPRPRVRLRRSRAASPSIPGEAPPDSAARSSRPSRYRHPRRCGQPPAWCPSPASSWRLPCRAPARPGSRCALHHLASRGDEDGIRAYMPATAAMSCLLYASWYSVRNALSSLIAVRSGTRGFSIPCAPAAAGSASASAASSGMLERVERRKSHGGVSGQSEHQGSRILAPPDGRRSRAGAIRSFSSVTVSSSASAARPVARSTTARCSGRQLQANVQDVLRHGASGGLARITAEHGPAP